MYNSLTKGVYIGQTRQSLNKRLAQHKSHPNKKMQRDIQSYPSFWEHVETTVLAICSSSDEATKMEKHFILVETPTKYNNLRSAPTKCDKYWFLRRRGLLHADRKA